MSAPGTAAMVPQALAVVIVALQAAFLGLVSAFLLTRRAYERRARVTIREAQQRVDVPLRSWLVAGAHAEPVARALHELPLANAAAYGALLARQSIPEPQRAELALALRGETWVATAIGQAGARAWWRRLEAARALSIVGGPGQQRLVLALLHDTHPAVQVAAAAVLPRVADPATLGALVGIASGLPRVVRHELAANLREVRRSDLPSRIELADSLDALGV